MNNTLFYHISKKPLELGTNLLNGQYGKYIQSPRLKQSNYPQYIKEEVFERVRLNKFPDAPSRFNCVFLFQDLISAKFFNSSWNKYKSYLYEIEVLNGKPYLVEMDLLECNGRDYSTIEACAEKYWSKTCHKESCTLEVLVNGDAVVRNLISEPSTIW